MFYKYYTVTVADYGNGSNIVTITHLPQFEALVPAQRAARKERTKLKKRGYKVELERVISADRFPWKDCYVRFVEFEDGSYIMISRDA